MGTEQTPNGDRSLSGPNRILVVEDDPAVCDLFEKMLPEQDLVPIIVESAEQAVSEFAKGNVDLVVADKNLPGMSGIELIKYVKANDPTVDVIIITAYADTQSILKAINAGVYDYILKPFESIDGVFRTLQRALEKRRIVLENLRLLKDLKSANSRIEDMNRGLERQIEERTEQLRTVNKRLEELTLTDDVTGLFNQRFLYERLEEELQREARYPSGLSVIMIDLDSFKLVNDNHDHIFGSRVLRRVGEVLSAGVRSIDCVVRYGGDEFVVILPHTSLVDSTRVADRLCRAIAETDMGDGEDAEKNDGSGAVHFQLTASLGVACLENCRMGTPQALLRAADKALYRAKARGRNCVVSANDIEVAEAG